MARYAIEVVIPAMSAVFGHRTITCSFPRVLPTGIVPGETRIIRKFVALRDLYISAEDWKNVILNITAS